MSIVVRAAQAVVGLALGLATATACLAAPQTDWSRNPKGLEIGVQQEDGSAADSFRAWVTLRACRQPSCFQTKQELTFTADKKGIWVSTLPIAGGACKLSIAEVPYGDIDSNDWRITPVAVSPGGCASAPAGLAGIYKYENPGR